jgi:hypothetical protein
MEWWFRVLLFLFQVKLLGTLWVVKLCEQSYLNQMAKYVSKQGHYGRRVVARMSYHHRKKVLVDME